MANWATTDYKIEGPKETLEKIKNAILHPDSPEDATEGWEGGILKALGIDWQEKKPDGSGYYMRGFIQETPVIDKKDEGYLLSFWAEEAWGATDFHEVLEKNIPDIKVYYVTEEPDGEVYATNDEQGLYFPYRYYVDTCIGGNYKSDYFVKKEDAYSYISDLAKTEIKNPDDIEKFKENCDEDDFIAIHEFAIVK